MTVARVFKPRNRLQSVLADQGGSTVADLVAAAERNTSALKPRLRASVERDLAKLMLLTDKRPGEVLADCETWGLAASGVAEIAAACDMAPVGEVARGVYAMITALRTTGLWHADAVKAHMGALTLFASEPGPNAMETRQILDRLASVRTFIGVPP